MTRGPSACTRPQGQIEGSMTDTTMTKAPCALTEDERWTLIHALAVAADEYNRLALGPDMGSLSEQFRRQAKAARAMAARLECAVRIEVTA